MTDTTKKFRAVFLAALMVLSVFAGTVAFAGTAAAVTDSGTTASNVAADDEDATQRIVFDADTGGEHTLEFNASVLESARVRSGNADVTDTNSSTATLSVDGAGDVVVDLEHDTDGLDAGTDVMVNVTGPSTNTSKTFTLANHDPQDVYAASGATFWAGQGAYVEDPDSDEGTYQIRELDTSDDTDEVGTLVTEFNLQEGSYVIDTGGSQFEAGQEYVITTEDRQVVEIGDVGQLNGTVAESEAGANSFEIQTQTLDAEFDEDSISSEKEETADLEFTSNRGTYDVIISADGMDAEELEEFFDRTPDSVDTDDDEIRFNDVNDNTALTVDATDTDAGDYNFTVAISDTDAEASAAIEVTEAEGQLSLPDTVFEDERGDEVEITTTMENTDTGFITIGSEDVGYNVTLEVEDGGDGEVGILWNTYHAGIRNPASANFELTDDSDDDDDSIENVYRHSEDLEPDEPLEAGDYDVSVGTEEDTEDASTGVYVDDEDDITTVSLNERSTEGVQIWTAPGDADWDDQEELLEQVTQTNRVSDGDFVVVQVQASGVYGYLEEDNYTQLSENGINLTIEEGDPGPNQDAQELNLTANDNIVENFYVDDENNSMFLVVEADAGTYGDFEFEEDERYSGTWEITEDNRMIEEDDDTAGEEKEEAESQWTLTERDATIRGVGDDEVLDLPAQNTTLEGRTTVAPGTELNIRVRGTSNGQSYLQSVDTTVSENRTFNATVNMTGKEVGSNFTVVVRSGGEDISDEYDGTVGEANMTETGTAGTQTETPGETTTAAGGTPTATATPSEGTPTPTEGTPESTPSPTPTNTPGFGIGIAVVALLGAALLALRRD